MIVSWSHRSAALAVAGALTLLASPALGQEAELGEEAVAQTEPETGPSSQIIPFPVLISDPTNGFGLGGGVLTLYRLNETSTRDSQTTFVGYYTTTRSWRASFQQILSLAEDRFRGTTTGAFGNTNNSFSYSDLPSDVVFGERQDAVDAELMINVFGRMYAGAAYRYAKIDYRFDRGTEEEREFSKIVLGLAGAEKTTDSGLGVVMELDSRDHQYTPTEGVLARLQFLAFRRWLGADDDYRSIDANFNAYRSIRPDHILAFRFRWREAFGEVPFSGESTFSGIDLRAYPAGKYRGDGTLAGQVEYRFPVWKRLDGVAFAGTGRVYGDELTLGSDTVLPSGGGGIRFLLLPDRGTNVGLDFAVGRFGNKGLYFFLGESF